MSSARQCFDERVAQVQKGAPLSHPEAGDTTPPQPTVSNQFKTDVAAMTEPFEVVQQGLEFAPGAATPWNTHPGLVMVTVLAGELTFSVSGVETVYREGESFMELPGELAQTRVMASYLLPAWAPLSHPQAAPGAAQPSAPMAAALPSTAEPQGVSVGWPVALAGVSLLLGGA